MTSNEKMAYEIDEIYKRLIAIENLMADLMPGFEKVSREKFIREIRERFEKDETFTLIKRIGDNISIFVTLLNTMKAVKGLLEDMSSVPPKISREISPVIRDLREQFERDEALTLIQNIGKNINAFNKLLDFLHTLDEKGDLNLILERTLTYETRYLIKGIVGSIVKTMEEFRNRPPKPSLIKLISLINNPEVQKGLLLLLTFAKNLPICLETIDSH